jgi:hypothetical protein
MQIGSSAATRVVLLIGLALLAAVPSRAVDFTLEVLANGSSTGTTLTASDLGCTGSGVTATCSVQNRAVGDLLLTNVNISLDTDPVINGVVAVQNTGPTQQFTMIFTLGVAPIGPSSVRGGSVAGGVTDNDGNGATLSTVVGSALYSALLDGIPVSTLFGDPTSVSVPSTNPFESADLPSGTGINDFGTPIPSLPGPAVATSIGIKYDFTLTSQDAASFTGVLKVEPIPEPTTAVLMGLGLLALGLAARRR